MFLHTIASLIPKGQAIQGRFHNDLELESTVALLVLVASSGVHLGVLPFTSRARWYLQ